MNEIMDSRKNGMIKEYSLNYWLKMYHGIISLRHLTDCMTILSDKNMLTANNLTN